MMKKSFERSDYKICPLCGASLDIGERCDCEKTETNTPAPSILSFYDISGQIYPLKDKIANKG